MSTSLSHTQSPPTSCTLTHVPQAMHPHDSDVEQGQCDQAEQPQDANAHTPPKRKSTRAIQPRRCGTGSHLTRKEQIGHEGYQEMGRKGGLGTRDKSGGERTAEEGIEIDESKFKTKNR
ncbi:hypothetical protein SO802_001430 [Lithocarpus litseifolius]|uniref:Uncharacterized protein n=1 Tax=Lithocarpus litseifolius TaxID=425828 RepID=A0AAW2E026_9ROSI